MSDEDNFITTARGNPINAALLDRLPALKLPQAYLVAGCLFQAIWNKRDGRRLDWGVGDYDIFYFDDEDLSWDAENEIIERVDAAFADVVADTDAKLEVRNQARVHLWYEARFGAPIDPLRSSRDGVDGFLVAGSCIGVEIETGALYAPYGLNDTFDGLLRMNANNPKPDLFLAKARNYQSRWPWLTIIDPP